MFIDKRHLIAASLGALIVLGSGSPGLAKDLKCAEAQSGQVQLMPKDDPISKGRRLSEWLKRLDTATGDEETEAINAINDLGPAGWPAVPALERIVTAPFKPIYAGTDGSNTVVTKLVDIQLRADAVDALAEIGEGASCSTDALLDWALTVKVVPSDPARAANSNEFLSIMGVDVLERMRVVAAVKQFGAKTTPVLERYLMSGDGEQRKLAVAIIDDKAIPVAMSLLKSEDCADRELGLKILIDMWAVVPRAHLEVLKNSFSCDGN